MTILMTMARKIPGIVLAIVTLPMSFTGQCGDRGDANKPCFHVPTTGASQPRHSLPPLGAPVVREQVKPKSLVLTSKGQTAAVKTRALVDPVPDVHSTPQMVAGDISQLAQEVGRLPGVSSPQSRALLSCAANRLLKQQSLDGARAEDLAMLIDKFGLLLAQCMDVRNTVRVLHTLAKEVAQRNLTEPEWSWQSLTMVMDGLRTFWGEEKNRVLSAVARVVSRSEETVSSYPADSLVVSADCISWAMRMDNIARKEATEALQAIAGESVRRDLGQWSSRNLSVLAISIGRAEGADITEALKAIARQIPGRDIGSWPLNDLANLVDGFTDRQGRQSIQGEEISKALALLFQEGHRRNVWGKRRQNS